MFIILLVIGCVVVGVRLDVLNVDGDVVCDMLIVSFFFLLLSLINILGYFGYMYIV